MVLVLVISTFSCTEEDIQPDAVEEQSMLLRTAVDLKEAIAYGPVRFTSSTGKPVVEMIDMGSLDMHCVAPPYTLYIVNGDEDGSNRVTSAVIKIGEEVAFGPSSFGKDTEILAESIDIEPGLTLSIELRGQPGTFIQVYIIGSGLTDPEGLVAYYALDGNVSDEGCNHHHGTASGNPLAVANREEAPGAALEFDGMDDFFTVPSLKDFSPPSWTIAAWVYIAEPATDDLFKYVLLGRGMSGNMTEPGTFGLVFDSEKGYSAGYTPCNSTNANTIATNYRVYDAWTHVVASRNAESGVLSMYINGEQTASESFDNAVLCAEQGTFMIGAGKTDDDDVNGLLRGRLDDIAVFNRALGASEVLDLYHTGL
jgi:hypothetical protein